MTRPRSPQAEQLGEHLRALPASLQPEVVVVSPLRRTLETAAGIFGGGPVLNGDAAAAELLMVAMEEKPQASGLAHTSSGPALRPRMICQRCICCAALSDRVHVGGMWKVFIQATWAFRMCLKVVCRGISQQQHLLQSLALLPAALLGAGMLSGGPASPDARRFTSVCRHAPHVVA